jgi:NADH-quinone oxidoreductase subunit G
MPTFYLDEQPIEFEPGEKILSAALKAGIEIPYYCYHPALSIVATCRMCLVDVTDMGNGRPAPKLMTSCSTDAAEGMKVVSHNESVREGRELVMEFLLVNHPLDCPICDQAGECTLQDYSYDYGTGNSEMEYSKRVYGWRDIGTFVMLERNRCIHCTRCDRFTREITGTHEFGMFNRGHQLTVDTFTDRPMTNKFQGNMADICPVGCITEREFRFKRRVWKLKKTNSICTHCSTGCNVSVEEDKNTVIRLKPRENQDVNQWWMCDDGRISMRRFNKNKNRLLQPMGRVEGQLVKAGWGRIYQAMKSKIDALAPAANEVVAITDTHASNEELYLLKKMMGDVFDSNRVFFPLRPWSQPNTNYFIDSLITSDKSPNRAGAIALDLIGDEEDTRVLEALSDPVKLVVVLGDPYSEKPEIQELVNKAELIVYIGTEMNSWAKKNADVLLPGRTHAEKEGTFTNKNNRVQRIMIAVHAPELTKPEWMILTELIQSLGKDADFESAPAVFDTLGSTIEKFKGLTYSNVGSHGCPLPAS